VIGMTVRTRVDVQIVLRKARRANIRTLAHAGAAIRLAAKWSIRKRKGPSAEGTPPHTHTRRLPRAILYAVEKRAQRVVIGPSRTLIGRVGAVHEHGLRYMGDQYEPRPYMGPALKQTEDRLPSMWEGSIR